MITVLRYLYGTLRDTLPSTTDEAGPFLAGMAWAFILHWLIVIVITCLHCSAKGGC